MFKWNILLDSKVVLLSLFLGILTGIFLPGFSLRIKWIGDLFLSILQMAVLPIMISAVLTSVARLVRTKQSGDIIRRLIGVLLIFLFSASALGLLLGALSYPMNVVNEEMRLAIGQLMIEQSPGEDLARRGVRVISIEPVDVEEGRANLLDFLLSLVPRNIFLTLAEGDSLRIIFFFLVMGIVIKFISDENANSLIQIGDGIFQSFQALVKGVMYFLPFGLYSLSAYQFSILGFSLLTSLFQLILLFYLSIIIALFIASLVMWYYIGGSYFHQFRVFRQTLLVAFGTRSASASIPSAIESLSKLPTMSPEIVRLTIPLGMSLCRFGHILMYGVGTILAINLQFEPLEFQSLLLALVAIVLTSMATSGAPGLIARGMIALVLEPISVSASAIIIIFTALDPIIDIITPFVNVYPNCAFAAVLARRKKGEIEDMTKRSLST